MASSRSPAASSSYDSVIVGGGHNGLVAAFYLAREGHSILVLERNQQVGGACVTEELFPGYRMSSCSYMSWNLQAEVAFDMELARHGLESTAIDPMPVVLHQGGPAIAYWSDEARTEAEIAKVRRSDALAYASWNEYWDRAARLVHRFFLSQPPTLAEIWRHAADIGEEELLEDLLTMSIVDVSDRYFEDRRIGCGLVAVCDVGDPALPGTAWSEAWWQTNRANGSTFDVVTGGMGSITQAMAAAAREQGVQIRTGVEVEEVICEAGRTVGVRTTGGEQIPAATVVSNADPKRTLLKLVPRAELPEDFLRAVAGLSTRAAYLKFHAVLDRPLDLTDYLGEGFDPRYGTFVTLSAAAFDSHAHAWDIAKRGEMPPEPVCHLQVPTAYDVTLTEEDGEILSIWVLYAPPRLSDGGWLTRAEAVGEGLIDYVGEFLPGFRSSIRDWKLFTPLEIERRTGMTDGNIRHIDMVPSQLYGRRPLPGAGYRTPISGLYLCGAGTHPGGEVTGAPGRNAAETVIADLASAA